MDELKDIAVELYVFVKIHDYPVEGTPNFFELTRLFDKLETTLKKLNIVPKNERVGKVSESALTA